MASEGLPPTVTLHGPLLDIPKPLEVHAIRRLVRSSHPSLSSLSSILLTRVVYPSPCIIGLSRGIIIHFVVTDVCTFFYEVHAPRVYFMSYGSLHT